MTQLGHPFIDGLLGSRKLHTPIIIKDHQPMRDQSRIEKLNRIIGRLKEVNVDMHKRE